MNIFMLKLVFPCDLCAKYHCHWPPNKNTKVLYCCEYGWPIMLLVSAARTSLCSYEMHEMVLNHTKIIFILYIKNRILFFMCCVLCKKRLFKTTRKPPKTNLPLWLWCMHHAHYLKWLDASMRHLNSVQTYLNIVKIIHNSMCTIGITQCWCSIANWAWWSRVKNRHSWKITTHNILSLFLQLILDLSNIIHIFE